MAKRTFGRHWVDDERDYKLRRTPTDEVKRVWKPGSVTDQGRMPSCVGHAWANWFSASPLRQKPIAPDGIYELAKYYDEWEGTDYDGTSIRGGAKVLKVTGHIESYSWAQSVTIAINYLLEKGPLVFGCNWYRGMGDTDSKGFIHPTGQLLGGHAVMVYGVNVDQGLVRIRNSWGRGWGRNGSCVLLIDDFRHLLEDEDGECCAAIERRAPWSH